MFNSRIRNVETSTHKHGYAIDDLLHTQKDQRSAIWRLEAEISDLRHKLRLALKALGKQVVLVAEHYEVVDLETEPSNGK